MRSSRWRVASSPSRPEAPATCTEHPDGDAALLARRLHTLGLPTIDRLITHTNRTVMVNWSRPAGSPLPVLRLHRGYGRAPDWILAAIVDFLDPRLAKPVRCAAERVFLSFPVELHAPTPPDQLRTLERARPGDIALLHRLESAYRDLDARHFEGRLGGIPIRLSGRMRARLGELSVDLGTRRPVEIALSRRHLAREPWPEVVHTLLHEMVHQWQAENGLPIDHGRGFRAKAREVGIDPRAKRAIGAGG